VGEGVPYQLGTGQADGAMEKQVVGHFRGELAVIPPLPGDRIDTDRVVPLKRHRRYRSPQAEILNHRDNREDS
jgi:hypothetical protein